MASDHPLNLHEELLLLALHDEKGTVAFGSMFSYAIAGAVTAELMLEGRLGIESVKRSKLVNVIDPMQVGDPVLDEPLERIRTARRRASIKKWVDRLARNSMRDRIAERLCLRGILRKAEGRVLLIFSRRTYPTVDPAPERELVARMRRALVDHGSVDARTATVLALASGADLLGNVFEKAVLKSSKQRIKQLVAMSDVGRATKEVVDEVRTAVMTASSVVTITSVASTS